MRRLAGQLACRVISGRLSAFSAFLSCARRKREIVAKEIGWVRWALLCD